MSCVNCGKTDQGVDQHPCLCDQFIHPQPLDIGAGLEGLPRQIATFPEFRRAMLHMIKQAEVEITDNSNQKIKIRPLLEWRARGNDDLGIMLLEMWAYICDCLTFYDEVVANETYLRTSRLRPHVRRLVALLGYLPRPAAGSLVELAALADGRLELRLPPGTAFTSGAFNGNPPQVFELDKEAFIHPLTNRFKLKSPHPGVITANNPAFLLVEPRSAIKEQGLLLIVDLNHPDHSRGVVVKKVERHTGRDARQYTKVTFASPAGLVAGSSLNGLELLKPTQSASLWMGSDNGLPSSARGTPAPAYTGGISTTLEKMSLAITAPDITGIANTLTLNSLVPQIKAGDFILVTYGNTVKWFIVAQTLEVNRQAVPSSVMIINGAKFTMPGITTPVTQLTIDVNINSTLRSGGGSYWDSSARGGITVHYGLQPAGIIVDEPNSMLLSTDDLYFDGTMEVPISKYQPRQFLLEDKNTLGASVGGSIHYDEKKLVLNQGVSWDPALTLPVQVYGNVITASRGEKVFNEIMGSGDASIANQTFKLRKKPLTYHLSPTAGNDTGVNSTLAVYINKIKWSEVNNFFGKKENDQVYIVRQNDEGDTLITFGDGTRGERLPSGTDNVIANYRFGAGAACPPAGSVNQITKPVKGLQGVKNVLSAFGGADAEPAENLRIYAPRSALILGRVVSMKDMEALAAAFPGVRAVQTEWRWNKAKQCASAHIFYIGEDGLGAALSKRLRNVSDPSIPIAVEKAQPVLLVVSLNIETDPRYLEGEVVQQLREALMNTKDGLLAPENIGIGQPLYRSRIFGAVLKLEGTLSIQGILLNGKSLDEFAVTPGTGQYFDVELGKLIINGNEN